MAKKKIEEESDWEIFTVRYQNQKFGTEGREYLPEIHTFMVSTNNGEKDALAAFEKYHPSARRVVVLDRKLAKLDDVDGLLTKKALDKLEKKKQ